MSLNQAGVYALSTILPWIGASTLVARMRVRMLLKSKYQIDDWTACAGMIVMWAVAALIIAGTAKDLFGTHTLQNPETGAADKTPADYENVEYMQIALILSIFAIGLIKTSILLLYRRIFSISHAFSIFSGILIGLVILWTLGFLLANIFQCGAHPSAPWNSVAAILEYCDDIPGATAALAITDLIMDIMIVTAPMPIVWRLQLGWGRKMQVLGIFGLGFIATAASAVRAYIFLYDSYGTTMSYRDIQGENTKIVVWSLVEIVAALMASCLPTLRPLISDTSFGGFLGSIFSVLSLTSRTTHASKNEGQEHTPTVATIGGTPPKNAAASEKSKGNSSLDLSDVGDLA